MKQMNVVKELNHCQPLFKAYCEDRVLREGDSYSPADYLFWVDNLSEPLHRYYEEKPKETLESKALLIAAKIMQAAGLCRYEDESMCQCGHIAEATECDKCIRAWLLRNAAAEMEDAEI